MILAKLVILLAWIVVRCGLAPGSVKSIIFYTICAYLVLSLRVGCSCQYAQMIFEFLFLSNFVIFVNMGLYGSEKFKTLLLLQL